MLREHRLETGLSCREVARRAGVSVTTVTRIENGTMDPTVSMMERLLLVFGKRFAIKPDRTHKVMPKTMIDVLSRRGAIADVCDRYGVAKLEVFGSVARGSSDSESDLDLLYVMKPKAQLGIKIERFNDELAEIFGMSVDLVPRNGLHPIIKDAVIAEAILLYEA